MIRQDYILRLVHEMVQMLARVVFLKSRREYEQALREINHALGQLGAADGGTASLTVDDWIALCRKHESGASGLTMATADLLREQGEIFAAQDKVAESRRSRAASLALFLEAMLTGQTFISAELLAKVELLIEQTADGGRTTPLWRRIVGYYETRGAFGRAEDELFAWAATGDEAARSEGEALYDRLAAMNDEALERGGLPRAEVIEGRSELRRTGEAKGDSPPATGSAPVGGREP